MKIFFNEDLVLDLNETKEKVIQYYVNSDIFEEDMKRRLSWIITHLYQESFKKLREEWDTKLIENGVTIVSTDVDKYAELVFAQPNYKDAKESSKK